MVAQQTQRNSQSNLPETLDLMCFPVVGKQGKIKFINKLDKEPVSAEAFKPITLLPTVGKILENIIKNKFQRELFNNNILHQNHIGPG